MTYKEYKEAKQKEVNDLPVFWAFSNAQFKEAMEARGLTENDTDKIYSLGAGGFFLRSDADKVHAYFAAKSPLPKLMKQYAFAKDAIYYEMCNHEYGINWQRNWDVLNCFAEEELPYYEDDYPEDEAIAMYFRDIKWNKTTQKAFWAARKKYFADALKNEWF